MTIAAGTMLYSLLYDAMSMYAFMYVFIYVFKLYIAPYVIIVYSFAQPVTYDYSSWYYAMMTRQIVTTSKSILLYHHQFWKPYDTNFGWPYGWKPIL